MSSDLTAILGGGEKLNIFLTRKEAGLGLQNMPQAFTQGAKPIGNRENGSHQTATLQWFKGITAQLFQLSYSRWTLTYLIFKEIPLSEECHFT